MSSFGKARPAKALHRRSRGFQELPRILVVCEGAKTEPFYLKALVRALGLRATSVLVIGDECESAPISVYAYAAERYADDQSFDKIFCVFDRDQHATFDAACTAIAAHPSKVFQAIVSNPCFEYWVLLHFRFTRAPFTAQGNNSPGSMLLKTVREIWPGYAKGAADAFVNLSTNGKLATAIQHAQRARADALATGEPNPSTDLDILVLKLQEMAEQQLRPAP